MVDEIVADAYGDDEQLSAFQVVMEDEVILPADASVIGEAVTVLSIDYENERRGLTARCRREDGSAYTVAACDLVFQESSKAADYIAAYRTLLAALRKIPIMPLWFLSNKGSFLLVSINP